MLCGGMMVITVIVVSLLQLVDVMQTALSDGASHRALPN